MNYKAIRLKNGELMACMTDDNISMNSARMSAIISVKSPVVFNSFKFLDHDGELVETISMMPLLPISDSETIEISTDHIFSIADMRPQAAERYSQFLEHLVKVKEEEDKEDAEAVISDIEDDTNVIDMNKFTTKIIH
jgi:hypothetical protein